MKPAQLSWIWSVDGHEGREGSNALTSRRCSNCSCRTVPYMKQDPIPSGQSTLGSLIEAAANVAIGFGVAVLTQRTLFPLLGIHVSLSTDLAVASVFTAVSLLRSFLIRRLFEAISACRRTA